jgi:hypothetical protein
MNIRKMPFHVIVSVLLLGIAVLAGACLGLREAKQLMEFASDAAILVSLAYLTFQAHLAVSQYEEDHVRSRREKAIELMMHWTSSTPPKAYVLKKYVETLSLGDCEKIYRHEPIMVAKESIDTMLLLLGKAQLQGTADSQGNLLLTNAETSELRGLIVRYLNTLECVLTSYKHSIADEEILLEEFAFLYPARQAQANQLTGAATELMGNFRVAAGGPDAYPAIALFIEDLKARVAASIRPSPKKRPLGSRQT